MSSTIENFEDIVQATKLAYQHLSLYPAMKTGGLNYSDILQGYLAPFSASFRDGFIFLEDMANKPYGYLVDSFHCLNLDCTCCDGILSVYNYRSDHTEEKEPLCSYHIDFKNYVFSIEESWINKDEENILFATVNAEITDVTGMNIYELIKHRHTYFRANYREHIQKDAIAYNKALKKNNTHSVNRNDICPCGSNKKYKKCCGHPSQA